MGTGTTTAEGNCNMSGTKVPGVVAGGAAATLPLTGSPIVAIVVAGVAMVVTGLLLVRSSRYNRNAA